MKSFILMLVAAVLLVGCGPPEPPDISIHLAAGAINGKKANIDAVKQHLAAGADVNERDADGAKTPLMHAVFWGHKEITEVLVFNGGDSNIRDKHAEATSLHYSVLGHDWETTDDRYSIVGILIKSGADINAIANKGRITKGGGTPLDMAIESKQVKIAELLRKHGGKRGAEVSIHIAAELGNAEAVKQHLAAGADVNTKFKEMTPLQYASYQGQKEVAELLIINGANINAKKENGLTALHLAAMKEITEIAKLLIENSADVNVKDKRGYTPLHLAAYFGKKEIAELLIAADADVNVKSKRGLTPLDYAIRRDKPEITDLLRKHGAKTSEELKAEGK